MAPVPFAMLELKFTAHASQLLTRYGGFYHATIDDGVEALIAALRAALQIQHSTFPVMRLIGT